jgi:uncharacterized protein (TIGR03083 family)
MQDSASLPPILVAPLFPALEELLIELLRSLAPDEWEAQTIVPGWKVKDVAAHLLDTQLRKLSMVRDSYSRETRSITSGSDLVALVNHLNAEGVAVYGRLSGGLLIALMELASRESAAYHLSLDPFSPAAFPVSWAGENQSLNWFDTAREFTERWHHQQQIRLAVNRPGILTPELYHPVLDCFMRALPHCYRNVPAPTGTLLQFDISGNCGGTWWLLSGQDVWTLQTHPIGDPVARTTIPQEIAWRLFTKGMNQASAEAQVTVDGDSKLGSQILQLRAIVG